MTTTGYLVAIYHYPSGRWLQQAEFRKRPGRDKDIETLPRLQVPGSYEIRVNRMEDGELGRPEYGYLKHVEGIWHAGQPDPWPRRCFWVPAEPYDERGWVPSLVIAGQPGHTPLTGNGTRSQPWFWGTSYEEARAVCARENEKTFRLTPAETSAIVLSSVFPAGGHSA